MKCISCIRPQRECSCNFRMKPYRKGFSSRIDERKILTYLIKQVLNLNNIPTTSDCPNWNRDFWYNAWKCTTKHILDQYIKEKENV